LSNVNDKERISHLIRRLDAAYSKGIMSPEDYGTLRHELERRLPAVKKPRKKKRGFQLRLIVIAVVTIVVLVTVPLFLRSSNRPDFEVSTPRLENDTLTLTIKNTGTADAHLVAVDLLYSKGKLPIQVVDILKTQDSLTITKKLNLDPTQEYGVQFNIVVSCSEGVTKSIPFKG
jgi:hypothetical protein